jgi:hypothetical protein
LLLLFLRRYFIYWCKCFPDSVEAKLKLNRTWCYFTEITLAWLPGMASSCFSYTSLGIAPARLFHLYKLL